MQNGSLFPIYHGSAKNNIGTEKLIEVIAETFTSGADNDQSELCGSVFLKSSTQTRKSGSFICGYTAGHFIYGIRFSCPKIKKLKITEMRIPSNGEIIPADTACCGEIVILTNDTLKLNDTLGNVELLPRKAWEKKSDSFASDDGGAAKSGTKRPPAECPDGNCRYRSAVALLCGYDNA